MKTLLNAVHSPVIFMKWYRRLVSFNRNTFLLINSNDFERSKCWCRIKVKKHKNIYITKVMTPIRSNSLLGLRGMRLGVEWPEPGGEPPTEEPIQSEGGMELMERKRPPRPSLLPTRHSISSARIAVLSFSSWIILDRRRSQGSIWC